MPMRCPHGAIIDWGDFGPAEPEHCGECEIIETDLNFSKPINPRQWISKDFIDRLRDLDNDRLANMAEQRNSDLIRRKVTYGLPWWQRLRRKVRRS